GNSQLGATAAVGWARNTPVSARLGLEQTSLAPNSRRTGQRHSGRLSTRFGFLSALSRIEPKRFSNHWRFLCQKIQLPPASVLTVSFLNNSIPTLRRTKRPSHDT